MGRRVQVPEAGFTFLEMIAVISFITVLMSILYLPSFTQKEKTAEIAATANYITSLYKAAHDRREMAGAFTFTNISFSDLVTSGFWPDVSPPLATSVVVEADPSDSTKVRIRIDGDKWLSKVTLEDVKSIGGMLGKRGFYVTVNLNTKALYVR